jgi:hypothetical protein
MKFTGQSKDGVFENLLRAYVSRPSKPHKSCTEFDPDQANAYIERRLTGSVHSQYEQHLSECTGCRKNVVALMRLAQADVLATIPAREVPQSAWFANIRQSFGILTRPQWALTAAALLVLGISLPLILTMTRNKQVPPAAAMEMADSTPQGSTTQASPPATLASARTQAEAGESVQGQAKHREKAFDKFDARPEVVAKNTQPTPGDAASAAGFVASADLAKKQGAAAVAQEEPRAKSESQVAQPQAQAPSAPGAQVARNEAQQTRQQQPADKDVAQQIAEPKTRADQGSAGKENSKRAEEGVAAPAPPTSDDSARDRGARRAPSKLALRDPKTGETVRVEERKISGKHFFFTGGAWTDKDYDPNKDLPSVTVIRDSNVYKELLSKRSGLKPIMALFTPSERAIIVYKGTVYKLIPQ